MTKKYRIKDRDPMVEVHLRLSLYLHNALRDLSERDQVSLNRLIHHILDQAVQAFNVRKEGSH